jgi:hypothetical protein
MLWCWRCKTEVPMLDEVEYAEVAKVHHEATLAIKDLRREKNLSLPATPVHEMYIPVRTRYEELTGMKDCNEDEVRHHRLSLYGPPCTRCGKPLRTPKAKLCGSCMLPADRQHERTA